MFLFHEQTKETLRITELSISCGVCRRRFCSGRTGSTTFRRQATISRLPRAMPCCETKVVSSGKDSWNEHIFCQNHVETSVHPSVQCSPNTVCVETFRPIATSCGSNRKGSCHAVGVFDQPSWKRCPGLFHDKILAMATNEANMFRSANTQLFPCNCFCL